MLTPIIAAAAVAIAPAVVNPHLPAGCKPINDVAALCGTQLTDRQAVDTVRSAGWSRADWEMALAVMQSESQAHPQARHWNSGSTDYGLYQINGKYHGRYLAWNLDDPRKNARAAYLIWRGVYRWKLHQGKTVAQAKAAAWSTWGGYTANAHDPNNWTRQIARRQLKAAGL